MSWINYSVMIVKEITLLMRSGSQLAGRCGQAAVFMCLFLNTQGLLAATQGALGASSSGSIEISLQIHPRIQINQLQDIQLSAVQGERAIGASPLCVSGNYSGAFRVAAYGSGDNGSFQLRSNDNHIHYDVLLREQAGEEMVLSSMQASDALPLEPCAAVGRTVEVSVAGDVTDRVPEGIYNGTLTLLVSPL